MAPRLADKIFLISGSTGIAAATATRVVAEGGQVLVCSRTEEKCAALAQQLGNACRYRAADLRQAGQVEGVVRQCIEDFGRIDALFNVAGISGRRLGDGPIHECGEYGWDATLEANLKSQFLLCRAVIGHMLRQQPGPSGLRGAVLNMTSVLGFAPERRFFAAHAYAASKGAIISLSRSMAAYYAPHKIRVNAIAPALVRTPMSGRAQSDADILAFMEDKQPLNQGLIEPEDVADMAVFLLSDEAKSVTGDVFTVDGGWCVSG
ncbi:MAG: SDR family oxidoreductase [Candidatus Latescibacteria bacterium]|nr:SDR family oxidoreductase [Candidatus Latescibacterota bacterium]